MSKIRIGIAGATGYGGQELLRLAARHPHAEVTVAMASSTADGQRSLPALTGVWSGVLSGFSIDALAREAEVVFLGLPDATSATVGPQLIERGLRVFDLSGAFRLRSGNARARWYPNTPDMDGQVVYGLTERRRDALKAARLVACPGCYPTAALLALEPLAEAGLLEGDVVIDAKSGISGAGKAPSTRTHFSECHGNVAAYGIFAHRHTAEIEQELTRSVTFVPHLVPLDRGILETIYVRVAPDTTAAAIAAVFDAAYRDAPFVRLRGEALPEIKHVAHTNFCDIGWTLDADGGRLVLVACLDNLVKGAAGQALQNFNVAYGFDEREGLV
jgi:N-acetyl-gamma-glutamyl-phosphate reductase